MAPARRYTPEQVQALRDRYRAGEGSVTLANRLGMTETSMRAMLTGRTYADVPNPVTLRPPTQPKLTHEQVGVLRERYQAGETVTALSREYGLSFPSCHATVAGTNYVDAPGPTGIIKRRTLTTELNDLVEQVKARPGTWARLGPKPRSHADRFRRRGAQTRRRRRPDGAYDLYIRWPESEEGRVA